MNRNNEVSESSKSSGIGALIDQAFDELHLHTSAVVAELEKIPVTRVSLDRVDKILHEIISASGDLIDGAGLALASGAVSGTKLWLEWWHRGADGKPEFIRHSVDENSIRFYDYTQMTWFHSPTTLGRDTVIGPYLDSGGTDKSIVTLSVPITAAGLQSVLAVDIRLERLESAFRKNPPAAEGPLVLCNEHKRVVASTSARFLVGDLVPENDWEHFSKSTIDSADKIRLPWILLEKAAR